MLTNFIEVKDSEELRQKVLSIYNSGYLVFIDAFKENKDTFIYCFFNPNIKKCLLIKTEVNIFIINELHVFFKNIKILEAQIENTDICILEFSKCNQQHNTIKLQPTFNCCNGINYNLKIYNEKIKQIQIQSEFSGYNPSCNKYNSLLFHLERKVPTLRLTVPLLLAQIFENTYKMDIPKRAEQIRKILHILFFIINHFKVFVKLTENLTSSFYFSKIINHYFDINSLILEYSGNRLFSDALSFGGVRHDVSEKWCIKAKLLMKKTEKYLKEITELLNNSKDFLFYTRDTGIIDKQTAISMGLSGVILRSCGIDVELSGINFPTTLGESGSIYDRFLIRLQDTKVLSKMLVEKINQLDKNKNINSQHHNLEFINDHKNPEGQINNFMLGINPISLPAGDYYAFTESSNGLTSLFLKSSGQPQPDILYIKGPSKTNICALNTGIGMNVQEFYYHLLSLDISNKEICSPFIKNLEDTDNE